MRDQDEKAAERRAIVHAAYAEEAHPRQAARRIARELGCTRRHARRQLAIIKREYELLGMSSRDDARSTYMARAHEAYLVAKSERDGKAMLLIANRIAQMQGYDPDATSPPPVPTDPRAMLAKLDALRDKLTAALDHAALTEGEEMEGEVVH